MTTPFLKWVGGKRLSADDIVQRFPTKIATYYEPMLGGGAVFFRMQELRKFRRSVLGDINRELMLTYVGVRDNPVGVINHLRSLVTKNTPDLYYKRREEFNKMVREELPDPVVVGAYLIYLNKTCFNGLYRVNKSGLMNSPAGDTIKFIYSEQIKLASLAMKNTEFVCDDFEDAVADIKIGGVAYFDPPYWPVAKSAFTSYSAGGFGSFEQQRLAQLAHKLKSRRVYAVFSNSDVPSVRKLYRGLKTEVLFVPRSINSDGNGRGRVAELIITT